MVDQTEDRSEPRSLAERRADATREAIVGAAWELSRREGLTGWSLRALAGAVGLKAPTLYAYFDAKHAIYDAMFREGYEAFDELTARWSGPIAAGQDTRTIFKAAARSFVEFCTSDPTRYQLMFQRVIPGFEPSAESYAVSQRQLARMSEQFAAAGIDDPSAGDLWSAMCIGLASQQIANDPGGDRWVRLVDTACDLLSDHVGLPHEENER